VVRRSVGYPQYGIRLAIGCGDGWNIANRPRDFERRADGSIEVNPDDFLTGFHSDL
jgi:hypothetical protein